MPLSVLNSPPLVAAVGAGALMILPFLEEAAKDVPFVTLKCANFLAYWISFGAVSVPGRIDGAAQSAATDAQGKAEMDELSPGSKGRTLVSPSGWAFSIWAPIFIGELIMVIAQLFEGETSSLAPMIKSATVPFVAANIFQSLWCAAFRPKYKGGWMAVSSAGLASTACSLSKVHTATLGLTGWKYVVHGLPISLHFGWVTAASLVNLNGAVAMYKNVSANTVAWLGHLSVVAATALGVLVTFNRKAPVYGGVICWALIAVSDGMKKRIAATKDEKDQLRVGVLGAKLQQRLSQVGAYVSAGASAFVTVTAIMANRASQAKAAP